ncbi:hypothetical protein LEP1GSC170_2682 [Leptospira interrogans serovar Bataviae str. HAI135]|nr:hypothetical protein LEP1GSC170_2682 [Leptospira interrogans serovar Bataviae str. HAI135]
MKQGQSAKLYAKPFGLISSFREEWIETNLQRILGYNSLCLISSFREEWIETQGPHLQFRPYPGFNLFF